MQYPDIVAVDEWGKNNKTAIIVHKREYLSFEGELFIRLIEHFGIVAGDVGGEDSTGRAKVTLQEPAQVIKRANEMTKLAVKVLEQESWTYKVPSYDELMAAAVAKQES